MVYKLLGKHLKCRAEVKGIVQEQGLFLCKTRDGIVKDRREFATSGCSRSHKMESVSFLAMKDHFNFKS